jgi:UDP-N-acetylglucosamine transferase subunit ALG13
MIVVTVGTHEQPFDRLVGAAALLGATGDPLLVQYGSSQLPHGPGEWVDYLSFDELAAQARDARAFVCHAGVGSIVLARRFGHRPIVMARRPDLGEHVDGHQLELSRRLEQAGIVTVVHDAAELLAAVGCPPAAATPESGGLPGADALSTHVRGVLAGLGTSRLSAAAA